LQTFSRELEKFHQAEALVFGVSRDSLASHKEFANKYDITVPLLTDTSGTVCQAYGVMEADQHRPERMTFVIDKHGRVCHIEPYMPDTIKLLKIIQAL
jgi:peroxiredoxin Q/BCP